MLYHKLEQMRERSGMFSCENVQDILTFIEGYTAALSENNIEEEDLNHFSGFNKFVQNQYEIESTHANWAMMIRFNSTNNMESLQIFFKLLAAYQEKTNS